MRTDGLHPVGQIPEAQPEESQVVQQGPLVVRRAMAASLLYALLHLTGYDSVTIDDIKTFRQWGSKTPGHQKP